MRNALIFDTETTGKVIFDRPASDPAQPHLVQLAGILVSLDTWEERASFSVLVQPGCAIEEEAQAIHGISKELTQRSGIENRAAVHYFAHLLSCASLLVAHNIVFDLKVVRAAFHRAGWPDVIPVHPPIFCTMRMATGVLKLRKKKGNGYKWPTLNECNQFFFGKVLEGAHDALVDARACANVFRILYERNKHGPEVDGEAD